MRFFDVIFATRLLEQSNVVDLWRQQEAGSLEYVTRAEKLQQLYTQQLVGEVEGRLEALFGFNITSSIGAMLPFLPKSFVSTTCEFPAVLSLLHRSGNDLAAWVCPFTRTVTRTGPTAEHMLLIVSHVDYISGQDIVTDVIETLADDPQLSQAEYTVIVDGAHGIGNHCTITDTAGIWSAFRQTVKVRDFVYIFDHNKWLHGFPGMAVTLHTGVTAPAIESIFPRRAETGFADFDEPVSVSYNPLLPHWTANFTGPARNGFDRDRIAANDSLAKLFFASAQQHSFSNLSVYRSNTNIALLTTPNPRRLHEYLEERGYRSHLMGASRIRKETLGGAGGVRLTFSSHSVDVAAIDDIVADLRRYR